MTLEDLPISKDLPPAAFCIVYSPAAFVEAIGARPANISAKGVNDRFLTASDLCYTRAKF